MTDTYRELEELERRGWEALSGRSGAGFCDELMADDGLMVFPGAVFDKQATLQAIRDSPPWETFEMSDIRVIEASGEAATMPYRAVA